MSARLHFNAILIAALLGGTGEDFAFHGAYANDGTEKEQSSREIPQRTSSQRKGRAPKSSIIDPCAFSLLSEQARKTLAMEELIAEFSRKVLERGLIRFKPEEFREWLAVLPLIPVAPGQDPTEAMLAHIGARHGLSPALKVITPETAGTSRAYVNIIQFTVNQSNRGVFKVFSKGPQELVKEIVAIHVLESLELTQGYPVKVLDMARMGTEEDWKPVLFMTYAGAPDMEEEIRRVARLHPTPGDPERIALLKEHLEILARAQLEIHRKFEKLSDEHPDVQQFKNYELGRQKELYTDVAFTERMQEILGGGAESRATIDQLIRILDRVFGRYQASRITRPTASMGDSYPGNYSVLTRIGRNAVFFDVQDMLWSVQGQEGALYGTTDPMNDIGRFAGGLFALGISAGMTVEEVNTLLDIFSNTYFDSARREGQSLEEAREEFQPALDFFTFRFLTVSLKSRQKLTDEERALVLRAIPLRFSALLK